MLGSCPYSVMWPDFASVTVCVDLRARESTFCEEREGRGGEGDMGGGGGNREGRKIGNKEEEEVSTEDWGSYH